MSAPGPSDAVPPRRRRGSGNVTIRDVARLAGVSPITVSRALSRPEQVSASIQARVREAVQNSGYVPNLIAGALSSGRSRLVAAVVPTISTLTLHPMLQALGDTLESSGYHLLLGQAGYDNARLDGLLETILGRQPGGIVLTGLLDSPLWRQRLQASGVPVVETWDLSPTPIDMLVGFSHADMARAVVRFLHARGRRQLALLGADDARAAVRSQAFVEMALQLGLPRPVLQAVAAPATLGSGREGLAALLAQAPDVSGIFCSSDLVAMGVLAEAAARGLSVPGQLSVVGCGDLPFSADLEPALTTVNVSGEAIGRQAARCIIGRIEGQPADAAIFDLGFSIVERASS